MIRATVSVIVIAAILLCAYIVMRAFGITELSKDDIRVLVSTSGAFGPLLFVFITFLQVTVIPIPSTVTVLAGSYVFGALPSYLYSYIGLLLGSAFAFLLGRRLGRPFVEWIAGSRERVDSLLARLRGRERVMVFFMFLLPAFPDDLICAIAGILPISFPLFMLMQLLTRATSVGATLLFMSGEVIPYRGWGLAVIIAALVLALLLFVLSMIYAQKINDCVDRFIARLLPGKKQRQTDAKTDKELTEKDEISAEIDIT